MDKKILDFATLSNLSVIEESYKNYLEDPQSVDPSWRHFFEGIAFAKSLTQTPAASSGDSSVQLLINNWRRFGHFLATTNPLELGLVTHDYQSRLSLEAAGFSEADLSKSVSLESFHGGKSYTLKELEAQLKALYAGNIGFEFMGYTSPEIEQFISSRVEAAHFAPSKEEMVEGLTKLIDTETFEEFLNKKYPGQKRFSVEGCATLIPLLHQIFASGSEESVNAFVIGMAHRGRLSVLANLMNKPYSEMFAEFDPNYMVGQEGLSGDVKYHMGYETSVDYRGKKVDLLLCANPSHLESVNPVVLGKSRALQDKLDEAEKNHVCPILVHGDASVAGQGIVYETMQMLHLKGYTTKGTIHIVVNNQVGFTATSQDTQSMHYTTDLAKAFSAPVFHVNAEDTIAVLKVAKLAIEVRQAFGVDVVIEIVGYRKYGHNEGDEPAFTQPVMYKTIREKKPIRALFKEQLTSMGVVSAGQAEEFEAKNLERCELAFTKKQESKQRPAAKEEDVTKLAKPDYLTYENLQALAQSVCHIPASVDLHRKMKKVLQDRLAMVSKEAGSVIDWGMAETLAMALLLRFEKLGIRLSGQDSMRGTFAHRHACFFDQTTNEAFTPLTHLSEDQASFQVYNALLSEYGALGFEYGYAINNKESLAIWEAQFGDFANAAQIVIDQYIASGYQKWGEVASLMLLLPHGYEGQGPEHSSARVERFLQLAANQNMDIFLPSTAAAYFQAILSRKERSGRPSVIFTPKALLRFAPSLASCDDLLQLQALPITSDPLLDDKIDKLILCSGKVVYDLKEARGSKKIAVVTIEQLYPFPKEEVRACIDKALKKNPKCQIVWAQEEHQNMGCWSFVKPRLEAMMPEKEKIAYVGRSKSASTAAGSKALHQKELSELIKEAME